MCSIKPLFCYQHQSFIIKTRKRRLAESKKATQRNRNFYSFFLCYVVLRANARSSSRHEVLTNENETSLVLVSDSTRCVHPGGTFWKGVQRPPGKFCTTWSSSRRTPWKWKVRISSSISVGFFFIFARNFRSTSLWNQIEELERGRDSEEGKRNLQLRCGSFEKWCAPTPIGHVVRSEKERWPRGLAFVGVTIDNWRWVRGGCFVWKDEFSKK